MIKNLDFFRQKEKYFEFFIEKYLDKAFYSLKNFEDKNCDLS